MTLFQSAGAVGALLLLALGCAPGSQEETSFQSSAITDRGGALADGNGHRAVAAPWGYFVPGDCLNKSLVEALGGISEVRLGTYATYFSQEGKPYFPLQLMVCQAATANGGGYILSQVVSEDCATALRTLVSNTNGARGTQLSTVLPLWDKTGAFASAVIAKASRGGKDLSNPAIEAGRQAALPEHYMQFLGNQSDAVDLSGVRFCESSIAQNLKRIRREELLVQIRASQCAFDGRDEFEPCLSLLREYSRLQ